MTKLKIERATVKPEDMKPAEETKSEVKEQTPLAAAAQPESKIDEEEEEQAEEGPSYIEMNEEEINDNFNLSFHSSKYKAAIEAKLRELNLTPR